tara:strand:+ start:668 stop:865 length:198 start_codon:yes stop_codon:yes gene_type:complete
MYKPKTTHYLYDLEYLLEKYKNEKPTDMCPDEWDIKIIGCTPEGYFNPITLVDVKICEANLIDWD